MPARSDGVPTAGLVLPAEAAAPLDAVAPRVTGPAVHTPTALAARNADQDVRYGLRIAAGYAWRLIVVAVAVYAVFMFLGRIQLVGVALFVGMVISALLRPVADWVNSALPRGLSVALSLLLGIALVAGVFTFIARSVAGQSATLAAQFSNGINEIERWLRTGPFHMTSGQLGGGIEQARTWIAAHQGTLVGQALGQAGVALEVLTGLALAIFCSIFFIHSGDRMWVWFLGQVPPSVRDKVDLAGRAGWDTFAGYTRGILIVAATNAGLVCLALLVLRVPLAFPLALLVFFATFIPIIGAPLALAVATVVALAGRGPLTAIFVLILIVVIGQLEGHVLQPMVMSRAVAIHPVVVALSVACGTVLAGIVGAVVAVPLVSVAWAVRRTLRSVAG